MPDVRRRGPMLLSLPRRLQWLLFAPALLITAAEVTAWSGYWWLSGEVQAAADQGVRAARTSRDPTIQEALARRAAAQRLPGDDAGAQASRVALRRLGDRLWVQVSYDASAGWIYRLRRVLPTPPSTLVRIASAPIA